MEELETNYQGNRLRYYVFGGDDLLLNADDVFAILGSRPEIFCEEYINLADAAGAAVVYHQTFSDWLLNKFSGYYDSSFVKPSGGNDP